MVLVGFRKEKVPRGLGNQSALNVELLIRIRYGLL
jgi:hypothetical protein